MASSNRHWPSMFKSKPCNTTTSHHHQWQQQHDINSSLISNACHRTPPTGPGDEERIPEPKPRWNPRPEQIRILEAIFNSGMVNPPRDEIRKIRAQLQEFGQVGDANIFYWFQNRKSRSKHKQRQRQLQNSNTTNKLSPPPPQTTAPPPVMITAASSSSSSSDKTSRNNSNEKTISANMIELLNSPTGSVNQPFFSEFLTEPFFYPVQNNVSSGSTSQRFCFPEVPGSVCDVQSVVDNCPSFLLSELMLMSHGELKKARNDDEDEKMKLQQQQLSYGVTAVPNNTSSHSMFSASLQAPSSTNFIFPGEMGPTKSTVFINDVCFEVGIGPFNVRETFGDDAMLIQSAGQPVVTNEWGVTLQPLQHGGVYYLVRAFTPTPHDDRATIHLI